MVHSSVFMSRYTVKAKRETVCCSLRHIAAPVAQLLSIGL